MSSDKPAISLQSKLIKTSVISAVIAGVCAFLILSGVSLYQSMQIQDEIMDEISDMLLVSDLTARSGKPVDEITDQFDIQYQLTLGGLTLTESEQFNQLNPQSFNLLYQHDEFGLAWENGELFRTYSIQKDELHLQLYQPLSVRFNELTETILSLIGILILLWLIQWFILHFAIKKQFKSLNELSKDISQKSAQDLTQIRQHQPELKELQPIVMQLNRMLGRLETSLLAEQRFTSDASHELRSPLSAIQMRLQLLKRKYENHELSADLKQIEIDVSRGSNVLNNLLVLARLDPTQMKALPTHSFDLSQVILEVEKSIELFALEKKIGFKNKLESVSVIANQELIYTCVRNLIDNAIRYASPQSEISVELSQVNQAVQISIRNAGERIGDEVIKRMGERFYRELGTKTQGSGLGLSICKKIIDLHQGSLVFSNPQSGGLIVDIEIPKDGISH